MEQMLALEKTIRAQKTKYYGKYRAFVADNADPEKRGRCKLTIPSVLGESRSDWAQPCLPYGGASQLGMIAVPPVGAQVVAEFLEGDASSPMWTGSFWRTTEEVPDEYKQRDDPAVKMIKTDSGHRLVFDDTSGEETINLTSTASAAIDLDENGSLQLTDQQGATVVLDAENGEIRIEDANGNSVLLSSSGITATDASGNSIKTEASGITVEGSTVTIKGNSVAVGGPGGEPMIKGTSFMTLFNTHTHPCTAPGAPSGPPLSPLTPGLLTTKTVAS